MAAPDAAPRHTAGVRAHGNQITWKGAEMGKGEAEWVKPIRNVDRWVRGGYSGILKVAEGKVSQGDRLSFWC